MENFQVVSLEVGVKLEAPTRTVGTSFRKNCWSVDEDSLLIQLVGRMGERRWRRIADSIPNRTGKQCRERYVNHLAPGIDKSPWSVTEEWALYLCMQVYGKSWARIGQLIPNRPDNNIKNHWNSRMRRKLPELEHQLVVLLRRREWSTFKEQREEIRRLLSEALKALYPNNELPHSSLPARKKTTAIHQSVTTLKGELMLLTLDAYLQEYGNPPESQDQTLSFEHSFESFVKEENDRDQHFMPVYLQQLLPYTGYE